MSKPTPKWLDIVAIEFLDHVEGSDRVERYLAYGRVVIVTKQAITIDAWATFDPEVNRENERENIKTFTLLRRVIENIEILKRGT